MTNEAFDVLLYGSPFCDLTFTFTDREELPPLGREVFAQDFGINPGGVFNIAAALARLDLRVGLKCVLGTDIFSRYIVERMAAAGLSTALTERVNRSMPVVSVGISFPHDRLFISYAEPDDPAAPDEQITADDLRRYRPRAWFSYGEHEPALYEAARAAGTVVVIDTAWDLELLHSPRLREVLPLASVFCPNLAEALEITGAGSPSEALDLLAERCACVAIKTGAEGCLAYCGGQRYAVPALSVRAVDTTGAGDNFNAGLIYGLLRGYPFETCLRCATIAGSLSTEVLGGSAAGATSADIEYRLREPEEERVG